MQNTRVQPIQFEELPKSLEINNIEFDLISLNREYMIQQFLDKSTENIKKFILDNLEKRGKLYFYRIELRLNDFYVKNDTVYYISVVCSTEPLKQKEITFSHPELGKINGRIVSKYELDVDMELNAFSEDELKQAYKNPTKILNYLTRLVTESLELNLKSLNRRF